MRKTGSCGGIQQKGVVSCAYHVVDLIKCRSEERNDEQGKANSMSCTTQTTSSDSMQALPNIYNHLERRYVDRRMFFVATH